MKKCLIILTVLLLLAIGAFAQAPNEISYQGKLTNAHGDPITEASSVTFAIYAASTGGTAIYTSTQTITPDENGIFTVNLAGVDGADFNGAIRYLGIKVGTDTEMTPRQRINSAPYSYSTQDIPSNSVNSANIENNTVTDLDLLDEPGISSGVSTTSYSLTSTTVNLVSTTIDPPTSGYVVVYASGLYNVTHTNGAQDIGRFCISTGATTFDVSNSAMVTTPGNVETDSDLPQTVSMHAVFTVDANPKTYYFNANAYSGYPKIAYCRIVAMFFPTAYGTVTNTAPVPDIPSEHKSMLPSE